MFLGEFLFGLRLVEGEEGELMGGALAGLVGG